jgi:hypothetical protein
MAVKSKTDPTPEPGAPAAKGFIDRRLMEEAIRLRREGLTMEAIGAKLGVKATAYLAKKIKQEFGPDALAKPKPERKPRRAKRAAEPAPTAKEA